MNTNHKLGAVREIALVGRLLRATVIATAVFALAFVVAPYIIAEANAATNVGGRITWSAIDLTFDPDAGATDDAVAAAAEEKGSALTEEEEAAVREATRALEGHGNVDFGTVIPTATNVDSGEVGTLKVEKKKISVATRGGYYAVYLSMVNETAGENPNPADTALNYDGATDTSMRINATSGTWDTPKTLVQNGTSGWGYMVPGTSVNKSDGTASVFSQLNRTTVANQFDGNLDVALYQTSGVVYTNTQWAGVPVPSAPQQIWKNTSSTGFAGGEDFDVYYAVNVDTDVMAGTYQNQVVYTAIASAQSLDSVSTNLARTVKFGATGSVQTIYFDMTQNVSGIVGEGDIVIKLVPHADMAAANFDPANLTAQQKQDAIDCPVVANSFTTVTATQAEIEGSTSSIQCTMPTGNAADEKAAYNAETNPTGTTSDGAYDYWLSVNGFNYNYVSKIENGAEAGFTYAGLQSVADNGTRYVTTMQDMTPGVCSNTYKWGNPDGGRGLGSNAVLYDLQGNDITSRANPGSWDSGHTVFTASTTADGVGSFALRDTRDGKKYIVRRLADGNCWMTQNLNLDLYTGMTLTSNDTDISEQRGSWVISDAANSNDEKVISVYDDTNYKWIANAGSTSTAWQTSHGVEEVRLYHYGYVQGADEENPTAWSWEAGEPVAECTGGTAQLPCYATASTGAAYYKEIATAADVTAGRATTVGEVMATPVAVNESVARGDGFCNGTCGSDNGSPVRGFAAGAYYVTVTYQVRKANTSGTGTRDYYAYDALGTTCGFSYYNDHLRTGDACVIETAGATMITQYSNDGAGIGMNSTVIPRLAITKDHEGNDIDFMNNTGTGLIAYSDATYTTYPMATSGADYRWNQKGRDGAHVMDTGPMYFDVSVTDNGTFYTVASNGSGNTKCANVGTVQGTLTLNGATLNFPSCMDGAGNDAEALADTRVDGNWYNWYAAVAGSVHPSSGATSRAEDSICPKGWELPSNNGGNNDFYGLFDTAYTIGNNSRGNQASNKDWATNVDTPIQAFPLSFLRSGSYAWYSGGLNSRGSGGNYWSAASYSTTNSYYLVFRGSTLGPRGSYDKGYGFAVRCVAAQ